MCYAHVLMLGIFSFLFLFAFLYNQSIKAKRKRALEPEEVRALVVDDAGDFFG